MTKPAESAESPRNARFSAISTGSCCLASLESTLLIRRALEASRQVEIGLSKTRRDGARTRAHREIWDGQHEASNDEPTVEDCGILGEGRGTTVDNYRRMNTVLDPAVGTVEGRAKRHARCWVVHRANGVPRSASMDRKSIRQQGIRRYNSAFSTIWSGPYDDQDKSLLRRGRASQPTIGDIPRHRPTHPVLSPPELRAEFESPAPHDRGDPA